MQVFTVCIPNRATGTRSISLDFYHSSPPYMYSQQINGQPDDISVTQAKRGLVGHLLLKEGGPMGLNFGCKEQCSKLLQYQPNTYHWSIHQLKTSSQR